MASKCTSASAVRSRPRPELSLPTKEVSPVPSDKPSSLQRHRTSALDMSLEHVSAAVTERGKRLRDTKQDAVQLHRDGVEEEKHGKDEGMLSISPTRVDSPSRLVTSLLESEMTRLPSRPRKRLRKGKKRQQESEVIHLESEEEEGRSPDDHEIEDVDDDFETIPLEAPIRQPKRQRHALTVVGESSRPQRSAMRKKLLANLIDDEARYAQTALLSHSLS